MKQIFCFFLILVSCNGKGFFVDPKNVVAIEIQKKEKPTSMEILDMGKINSITKCINESKEESLKFVSKYEMKIKTGNNLYSLSVNQDAFNVNGVTYRSSCNLEDILNDLTDNQAIK